MDELLYSLSHRWYVTLFLVSFLVLGKLEQGMRRTLFWMVSGYLIGFAAEWGSINHGIPFGDYSYRYDALDKDLLVYGVPFFDSLSFAFLSYVAFSFAQYFVAPLRRGNGDVQRQVSRKVRNSVTVLVLGAFLMVVIDWITDPVALLGDHFFLGGIYKYPVDGYHFGITQANYVGWFVVGAVTIFTNQRFDSWLGGREDAAGTAPVLRPVRFQGLMAPLFWTGILGFQLGVTAWLGWSYDLHLVPVGERAAWTHEIRKQFLCGLYVVLPILLLAWVHLVQSPPASVGAVLGDERQDRLGELGSADDEVR